MSDDLTRLTWKPQEQLTAPAGSTIRHNANGTTTITVPAMTCLLLAVEVTRDYNADREKKWLVTPVYQRHGQIVTIPDDRGWDNAAEAFREAQGIRESAQARGIWVSREAI